MIEINRLNQVDIETEWNLKGIAKAMAEQWGK